MFGDERKRLYRVLLYDSLEHYERMIEQLRHDTSGIALANRALAHAEIGEVEEALADFDAAIAAIPREPVPYVNRADVLERLERYDDALADLAAAIELEPSNVLFRRVRAGLLHKLGRHSEAVAEYDVAIELEPEFGYTREARACAAAGKPPP